MLCPSRAEAIRAPRTHEKLRDLRSLFGGMAGFCGESTQGHLQCWGLMPNGHNGPFEDYTSVSEEKRYEIRGDVRVAIGLEHACVVDARGGLVCWGLSRFGELGMVGAASTPIAISLPGEAVDVATTVNDTCALLSNGDLYCSGLTTRMTTFFRYRTRIRTLIHGFSNICFVDRRGTIDCLVPDGMVQHLLQTAEWDAARGDSVVLAGVFACVIGPVRRRLVCSASRLGVPQVAGGTAISTWDTVTVPLQHPVLRGAAGVSHACFVDSSNAVFCVGSNLYGQLARSGVGIDWRVHPIALSSSHCAHDGS
jgi:alpha-tubulin suppressor-like RCC1 family protein